MEIKTYAIRQCPSCNLRFPVLDHETGGERCPHCGALTVIVLQRELSREQLPVTAPETGCTLEAVLDNIRSAWNVGSIFRSADGLGLRKLHLCGITPAPPHDGIAKTALGAEAGVEWQYHKSALVAALQLKKEGVQLWGLEHHPRAVPITDVMPDLPGKVALVVGNELAGIDPELLDSCDEVLYIPMRGRKRSLNVAVAFGIAACTLSAMQRARS